MNQATDPDFVPPVSGSAAPTLPDGYPAGSAFVVVDLFTPTRCEHASLVDAVEHAQSVRFPDDLLIIVYRDDGSCDAVLDASGFDVNLSEREDAPHMAFIQRPF